VTGRGPAAIRVDLISDTRGEIETIEAGGIRVRAELVELQP
jgi:hypothetical protein